MSLVESILTIAVFAGTSLTYAAVGEIVVERAGILNLGVEGMMLMGAVTGFAAALASGSVVVGIVVAAAVAAVMALVHAFLTITLRADQVVTGLAITIAGTGLSSFLGQRLGPDGSPLVGLVGPRLPEFAFPGLAAVPVLGKAFFTHDPLVYLLFLVVPATWWVLERTRPGLHLRAVGEHPQTADAMGVPVFRYRYAATIVGGAMAGVAGAHLSLAYTPGWTENLTGGRGWIAIALVIFALWDPRRAVLGALLFGGVNAIQFRLQAEGTTIPASLLNMMPYLLTVVVLVIITRFEGLRQRVGAPAALGIPYDREERV